MGQLVADYMTAKGTARRQAEQRLWIEVRFRGGAVILDDERIVVAHSHTDEAGTMRWVSIHRRPTEVVWS